MPRCIALIALALFSLPCARSQGLRAGDGGWIWQNPLSSSNSIFAVHFVPPQTGWAIGEAGAIIRTDTTGASGRAQISGTDAYLSFAHFLDESHGWIIGFRSAPYSPVYSVLLATSDGGATWLPQDPATTELLYSVRFTDPLHGWLVGEHGTVRYTENGGKTWRAAQTGAGARLSSVFFNESKNGWIVGGDDYGNAATQNRVFLRTTDAGATWTGSVTIPGVPLIRTQFLDAASGWATDGNGALLQTEDGGLSWSTITTPIGYVGDFQRLDGMNGWANGSSLWRTTDNGATWEDLGWQTDGSRHDFQFVDAQHGFSVHNGAPYVTADGGHNWQPLFPPAERPSFKAVSFPDAQNGWALASGRILWHTVNAGLEWKPVDPGFPATQGGADIHFPDTQHGWIVGTEGLIFHTDDGGARWEPQASGTTENLGMVYAVDANNAWARGGEAFLRTRDGGETWESLSLGGPFHFVNADTGFRVARNVVQVTKDGGLQWADAATLDAGYTLGRIHFLDENNGLIGGYYRADPDAPRYPAVLRTTDGGKTWTDQPMGGQPSEIISSVRLFSPTDEWVMTYGYEYHSTDAGQTWSRRWLGSSSALVDADFPDPLNGWAVGALGTILHTTTGGLPPGDVNADGVINGEDARLALAMVGGLAADPANAARADADGDGSVTLTDVASILRSPSLASGTVEGVVTTNDHSIQLYGTHLVKPTGGVQAALISVSLDLRLYVGQKVRLRGEWLPGYPSTPGYGPPMLNVKSIQPLP